ncbi:N,N-dimethylformamidase beta subunit family domain-containing protein [Natrarchaeobius chitinivorans]|uniref:N,N-dimethylformamidase n=1 Tax=Natrarchaeobius chitinivorans TaxID=1679083 RepID=A0A3N6P6Z3_NATCH|nr:N,N-dimethylformamidase beta subunit family domain-containing protein [Natrarchaeobius chitinivorans]RQG94179.1 N,N-dimethylformamidase [Natrarchaeobius chitinivorans]
MTSVDDRAFGEKHVTGYCNRWAVWPGETIEFMVNCVPTSYHAEVVRLVHGDPNPDAPPTEEHTIETSISGTYPGQTQEIHAGSYVEIPHNPAFDLIDGCTLLTFINPTTPDAGHQSLLSKWDERTQTGYDLHIDADGSAAFRVGLQNNGESVAVSTGTALEADNWYALAATFDGEDGRLGVWQVPIDGPPHPTLRTGTEQTETRQLDGAAIATVTDTPVRIAGTSLSTSHHTAEGRFNGRIERPRVYDRVLEPSTIRTGMEPDREGPTDGLVAAWNFASGLSDGGIDEYDLIVDVGPNGHHGQAVQMPTRGVPGVTWTGETEDFARDPDQFGAIHFHDDDLVDADWDVDFEWTIPEGFNSGVYAVKLQTNTDEYYVPFFVTPEPATGTAPIAVLAPTATYLAYANYRFADDGGGGENAIGMAPILDESSVFLDAHPEYGNSLYDLHTDGHGCMYSSRLRPLINVSPSFIWGHAPPSNLQAFAQDLYLIAWLEHRGFEYDVITDDQLDEHGQDLLEPYNAVVTGSHPEYCSERMLDSIADYTQTGGRLLYLGGNGFYHAAEFHPDGKPILEVRRPQTNMIWTGQAGEIHHAFNGEKGGMWWSRDRHPQKLTGVGFSAQWEPSGGYYRRLEDSYHEDVEFIFDGVDAETFGRDGFITGAAAGQEMDRYDRTLGSPEDAFVLASSEGHSVYARRLIDENQSPKPFLDGPTSAAVRADMVYFRTGGGAVFSTGSMAWLGSLPVNGFDNDVARITGNVLEAFAADEPLPGNE